MTESFVLCTLFSVRTSFTAQRNFSNEISVAVIYGYRYKNLEGNLTRVLFSKIIGFIVSMGPVRSILVSWPDLKHQTTTCKVVILNL